MKRLLAGIAVVACVLAAGCGAETEPPTPAGVPSSFDPRVPALTVEVSAPVSAHQGFPVVLEGGVLLAERPLAARVEVDFGDGTPPVAAVANAEGRFRMEHIYLRAGEFVVVAEARYADAEAASVPRRVLVHPRKVIYIQGMLSDSECPDGRRFATRAPAWLGGYLAAGRLRGEMTIEPQDQLYFSYSGEYCDGGVGANGAAARYRGEDTCGGIERLYAGRLRMLIDAAGASRVTIVAHSMGGLIAAFLVASDPAWARQHIASVVTFDSPLGGIDLVRAGALSAGGWFTDDCGATSRSVKDLDEDGSVVRTARTAGSIVPFYTLDGTAKEERTFGRIEAVPGPATRMAGEALHARVAQVHADIWGDLGDLREFDKRHFVVCALHLESGGCLD